MSRVRRSAVVRKATPVYVGIGSNIRPRQQIRRCLRRLQAYFGRVVVSPAYRAAAVGFDGPVFINLVVRFDTTLSLNEMLHLLRVIEGGGLRRCGSKNGSRAIDLDLLLFGNASGVCNGIELPRPDVTRFAFVLWPLADMAPHLVHPGLELSCRQLRNNFSSTQRLCRCQIAR